MVAWFASMTPETGQRALVRVDTALGHIVWNTDTIAMSLRSQKLAKAGLCEFLDTAELFSNARAHLMQHT